MMKVAKNMLNLKLQFQNKKGFTLLELILGVVITSMLIIILYTSLSFHFKINYKNIIEDEIILNGKYILEYIKEEIYSADKIICSHVFDDLDTTYPTNIGFVILNLDKKRNANTGKLLNYITYSYTTYYFKNNSIVRLNAKKNIERNSKMDLEILKSKLPKAKEFSGYNTIGYNLLKESKISLNENNMICFDLYLKEAESKVLNFSSNMFIRCQVVK